MTLVEIYPDILSCCRFFNFGHVDSPVQSHLHWWHTLGVSSNQTGPPAVEESDWWRVSTAQTAPTCIQRTRTISIHIFEDNILCILSCTLSNIKSKSPVYRRFMVMRSHLFKEWWVISQVLGNHIETEKMTIDAFASHGHSVEVLVLFCCQLQKSQPLLSLNEEWGEKNESWIIWPSRSPEGASIFIVKRK